MLGSALQWETISRCDGTIQVRSEQLSPLFPCSWPESPVLSHRVFGRSIVQHQHLIEWQHYLFYQSSIPHSVLIASSDSVVVIVVASLHFEVDYSSVGTYGKATVDVNWKMSLNRQWEETEQLSNDVDRYW